VSNDGGASQAGRARRRRRSSRSSARARSHEDFASSDAGGGGDQKVPDHPGVPRGAPIMVTDDDGLAACLEAVRAAGRFAYDTEFIGEDTYDPVLCLVQVGTEDHVYIIDPLEGVEVEPVLALVADPHVETIVHAGQQDLEPVLRLLGHVAANVFDTQVAAGFTDRPYPLSLRDLVHECIGIRLGKGATFTDWSRRPLSRTHLRYAADDVRYLLAIRERLDGELDERGHRDAFAAECANLCASVSDLQDLDARTQRVIGNRKLTGRARLLVRWFVELRETIARERDQPPRSVIKDDVLVRLARDPVKSIEKLENVRNMPRPIARSHGQRILDLAEEVQSVPAEDLPSEADREETPADRVRIDALWAMVSAWSHGRSIDPRLIGSRRAIADWYWTGREGGDPWAGDLGGWRRTFLAPVLETMFGGEGSIRFTWPDAWMRAEDDAPGVDG